jgi:hypothetical protein
MVALPLVLAIIDVNAHVRPLNWSFGWIMILLGFLSGWTLGIFFHRDDFLGGYASFRRRIVRLGHISLVALGMLNLLFGMSPWPVAGTTQSAIAAACFVAGAILMPAVCFLTAWRASMRLLFPIPVAALIAAVAFTVF